MTTEDGSAALARQILACVVEMGERFGADYVADVLRGAETARIARMRHDRLEAYGLLRQVPKADVRSWIAQLEGQGCLVREEGRVPDARRDRAGPPSPARRGDRVARSGRSPGPRAGRAPRARRSGRGRGVGGTSDEDLFEMLRALRRTMAEERGIPPYLIFSDASLREMARERPTTEEAFLQIKGVGLRKLQELGPRFLACIREQQEERANTAPSTP